MASDNSTVNRTVTFADPPTSTNYVSVSVPIAKLNSEIMDVAFVKATNPKAYPGGLEAMMKDHRFGDSVPLGKHWSYKYLVDFDGMSYSGRFMAFLASDSVAVKSTVYEEFFSDWIQPWYAPSGALSHFAKLMTSPIGFTSYLYQQCTRRYTMSTLSFLELRKQFLRPPTPQYCELP